jgi:hypothetical protein
MDTRKKRAPLIPREEFDDVIAIHGFLGAAPAEDERSSIAWVMEDT